MSLEWDERFEAIQLYAMACGREGTGAQESPKQILAAPF
jgi:hypothetical protein